MGKKITIIILDDEPIVCDRLASSLEKEGYLVEVFTDSKSALECLEKQRFHILITDLKMSGPKGIDVIRFAKQKQNEIKVIVISGYATEKTANDAITEGAMHFIAKPFKLQQIKDLVAGFEIELQDTS